MSDKNVTNIGKEDRTFIKAVVELPEEKKDSSERNSDRHGIAGHKGKRVIQQHKK